ncbi:hypothetical protein Btru_046011 [Bulinus truncatus]|nr:hypothetical protein Btru_046011 [Bulinus truncatus]
MSTVIHWSDLTEQSSLQNTVARKNGTPGRNRNVFKGTVLVSILVESHPKHFPDRKTACELGRKLFREGHIHSIFGAKDFEDSAQLFVWTEEVVSRNGGGSQNMTSTSPTIRNQNTNTSSHISPSHRKVDHQLIEDIKEKLLNRSEAYNIVTSYNSFFQELEQDFGVGTSSLKRKSPQGSGGWAGQSSQTHYTSTLEHKKDYVHSTDSSQEAQHCGKLTKDISKKLNQQRLKSNTHSQYSETQKDNSLQSASKNAAPLQVSLPSSAIAAFSPDSQLLSGHTAQDKRLVSPTKDSFPGHTQGSYHQNQASNPRQHLSHPGEHPLAGAKTGAVTVTDKTTPDIKDSQKAHTATPVTMDFDNGSNQQSTLSSHMSSSIAPESLDNNLPSHSSSSEAVLIKSPASYPSHQNRLFSGQTWVDPNSANAENYQHNSANVESYQHNAGKQQARDEDGLVRGRPWPESTYSYSDNEKQLLEEMRRMKKEHQTTLRTYESRINKLMAKMHELRNIAEMLENSSSKSSPYGVLPGKLALLNILADKDLDVKKLTPVSEVEQTPPPLPPRPGRGTRVYPNKPIMHTSVSLRPLPWSRIILDENGEVTSTIWHGMTEPRFDTVELERLFSGDVNSTVDKSLYDDICLRRGKTKSAMSMYDSDRSQRIISEMKSLRCCLPDVVQAFNSLDAGDLHMDSFAELLELLSSQRELDKIHNHVKRKGANHLEVPEYLVTELSKVEHFRERLEFLRFKNKLQINLFEIDQQLRELHTACDEITTSLSLKHVLETVLAVGNYMNAGTERGQADGFNIDVLNTLKEIQDPSKQGNLLELIMRTYCLVFESEVDFGCPTRFRLPEPSNMRHAAQVSFDDIQRALKELKDDLFIVKNKLESLSQREGNAMTMTLKVASENFLTSAIEVLADEQKLLERTRSHFWKTASYFSHEGQRSSPQDFFQIWACFLHDCKYYWKLAHRNLAKIKFNAELTTKSQLSTSSVPSFNNLKSVMIKQIHISQEDSELSSNKTQQLQHINSWIESIGKYAGGMDLEDIVHLRPEDEVHNHQATDFISKKTKGGNSAGTETSTPYINQPQQGKSYKDNFFRSEDPQNQRAVNHPDKYHGRESPKPIKATPPNVIKPKPKVQTSPTSSPSPNTGHLTQPLSLVPYQQQLPVDTNNNRNKLSYHDDFGFDPLYESLPPQNHISGSSVSQPLPVLLSDMSSFSPSLNSPDAEHAQKKNAKFFKSLLKREQKKSGEENVFNSSPQPSQNGLVPAPKHKLRNTLFHKLAGSGQSKKSTDESLKTPSSSYPTASPPKPSRSFQHDLQLNVPAHSSTDSNDKFNKNQMKNNYYNLVQNENAAGSEVPPPLPYRPENLLEVTPYIGTVDLNTEYRDHQNKPEMPQTDKVYSENRKNYNSEPSEPSTRSGRIRSRAPIALGSNMSISDAYSKAVDQGHTQAYLQVPQFGSRDKSESGSSTTLTGPPNGSESNWVKANTVPVYKAKLIPNYENQTKYDPRYDVGVRGQAEPAPRDQYRQELQKRSEQYVSGGTNLATGQSNSNTVDTHPFKSQSYADRIMNPNHFHASPIIDGREFFNSGNSQENSHSINQIPSTNHHMGGTAGQNFKNDLDVKEKFHASKEHGKTHSDDVDSNFIKKPAGWRNEKPNIGQTDRQYLDRKTAHRSSSAHNMLDRDYESNRPTRQAQSADMDGAKGRVSRRDMMYKKMTPTSHRGQNDVPLSVTSLIDRFEKKPDCGQPCLLDMDDKPPSMTSTPVVRRKTNDTNQNTGYFEKSTMNANGINGVRSRSVGRDLEGNLSTQDWKNAPTKSSNPDMYQNSHPSKSPHHAVAPFFVQPSPSSSAQLPNSSHQQQYADNGNDGGRRRKQGTDHQVTSEPRLPQHPPLRDLNNGGNFHANQKQDHYNQSQNHQFYPFTSHAENRGKGSTDRASSDRGRGSKNSGHNGGSQPAAPVLMHHSSTNTSNVLHKPEPLYPASNSQHDQRSAFDQHPLSTSAASNHAGLAESQQLPSLLPNQNSSQPTAYTSPQQQQRHSIPPYNRSAPPFSNSTVPNTAYNSSNTTNSNSQNNFKQEFLQPSKTNHSAFERPLKPGSSYNRQPGAMAVVKPTVLHL